MLQHKYTTKKLYTTLARFTILFTQLCITPKQDFTKCDKILNTFTKLDNNTFAKLYKNCTQFVNTLQNPTTLYTTLQQIVHKFKKKHLQNITQLFTTLQHFTQFYNIVHS